MDLTKAFDTINHNALWRILCKIGCLTTLTNLVKQLNTDINAHLTFNNSLLDEIAVKNGTR